MPSITREIMVDVAKKNLFQAIVAKQNDSNSRFLKITMANEGVPIEIPTTATAIINAERADGQSDAFICVINDDGTVTAPLTTWMLELDDMVSCSISVIGSDNDKLSTLSFMVEVQAAEYSDDDISQDENYDLLVTLISDCNDVKTACTEATNAANSAATAAGNAATYANQQGARAEEAADFFGSPLVAATVAGMTDQTRVYVYTGSESGYTAGNWYYYNGSAWVSGGVYNGSVLDGVIITDNDNNVSYLMKFRLSNGKPIIVYDQV